MDRLPRKEIAPAHRLVRHDDLHDSSGGIERFFRTRLGHACCGVMGGRLVEAEVSTLNTRADVQSCVSGRTLRALRSPGDLAAFA